MRAVLTRDRDEFLELRDRIERARAAHRRHVHSVHADSIGDPWRLRRLGLYVLSVHGASSEAARWLADRENAADLVGGARKLTTRAHSNRCSSISRRTRLSA